MKNFYNNLRNIYLILIFTGFLFVSILPKFFGMADASFSILFRAVVFLLAISIIIFTAFSSNVYTINLSAFKLFIFFWIIYSFRIFYDLIYSEIIFDSQKSIFEYFQYAFGVVLIPSVAVMFLDSKKIDFDFVLKWIYRILFVVLFFALFTRGNNVSGRSTDGLEIGILSFGQYGTSLCLLSFYLFNRNKYNFISNLYIIGFLIGFISIFISASKSPFVALLIVTIIFSSFKFGRYKLLVISSFLSILFYNFFFDIMFFLNHYFQSTFLQRLLYFFELGTDNAREKLLKKGFDAFIDNPFFGKSMLFDKGIFKGTYPHNLIIEAFMATGLFGGLFFLFYIIKCLKISIKLIINNSQISWISLFFFQFFIFGMFSGNLFKSNLFWYSSILIITVSSEITNHKSKI
jgi:hypothetical protein